MRRDESGMAHNREKVPDAAFLSVAWTHNRVQSRRACFAAAAKQSPWSSVPNGGKIKHDWRTHAKNCEKEKHFKYLSHHDSGK